MVSEGVVSEGAVSEGAVSEGVVSEGVVSEGADLSEITEDVDSRENQSSSRKDSQQDSDSDIL